jgi:hypothetical protein
MKTLITAVFLLAAFSTAHADDGSYCEARLKGGKVVKGELAIDREPGGPVANGAAEVAGLKIEFESGWGGVSEEKGGSEKYVFQNFRVYRGSKLLGEKDIGQGDKFSLDVKDATVASVRCQL